MARPALSLAAGLIVALAVALAACGGGDADTAPGDTGAPGAIISIEEALASTGAGPVAVQGFVVAPEGGEMRLCSALLESYPPQCGEPSLTVESLDLSTVEGLVSTSEPDLAQVSWTDTQVSITGKIQDGALTVSP